MCNFRGFSEETPGKMINQFPFEMVLTVKSLLPVVCRRGVSPHIDDATLDTLPSWLPVTFNLNTELAQFISYFQHRDARLVLYVNRPRCKVLQHFTSWRSSFSCSEYYRLQIFQVYEVLYCQL